MIAMMIGWLADACRCAWGLIYWNVRKSRYVLGGRRGRCPCQNPSDVGSSGGVRCDAARDFDQPLRFRRVCPLVVPGPAGRGAYCGVKAVRVRPFWGRALAVFGGGAAALYLAVATAAFVGLRATGLETLSWRQVAWPGAWGEIKQERSRYFLRRAMIACARRDYAAAYRSMVAAVAQDPRNYDARLLMAQYASHAGATVVSDRLFDGLEAEFPRQLFRTTVTRHDTLLAAGRFDELARFCLLRAQIREQERPLWLGSLLLAMRLGRIGPGFTREHQEALAGLGPDAGRLVQAVAAVSAGDADAALAALRHRYAPGAAGSLIIHQIQLLLLIGARVDAEMAWTMNAQSLPDFDRLLTRSWIDAGQGYRSLATMEFAALVDRAAGAGEWDKLVATLVMQPDREAFAALHRRALREASGLTPDIVGLLWVAALAVGAGEERDHWARHGLEALRVLYPMVDTIDFASADGAKPGTVPFLVGVLPLGRATIASLYWRMEPPAEPAAPKPRRS